MIQSHCMWHLPVQRQLNFILIKMTIPKTAKWIRVIGLCNHLPFQSRSQIKCTHRFSTTCFLRPKNLKIENNFLVDKITPLKGSAEITTALWSWKFGLWFTAGFVATAVGDSSEFPADQSFLYFFKARARELDSLSHPQLSSSNLLFRCNVFR